MISEADSDKLVFLDESGVNTDMTRHYGRAVGKERAVDNAPENTPTNTTILSSIRLNGETVYTTYSGGTTGDRFVDYLEKELIPTLHKGDIVIMDNMRSHHVKKVAEVLQKAKIQLLYSLTKLTALFMQPDSKSFYWMKMCCRRLIPSYQITGLYLQSV